MVAGRAIRLWWSHSAARTAGLESALRADFGWAHGGRKTGTGSPLPVPCFAPRASGTGRRAGICAARRFSTWEDYLAGLGGGVRRRRAVEEPV